MEELDPSPHAKSKLASSSDMRIRVKRKLQFTTCYEFRKIWSDNGTSKSAGITFFRVKPPKEFAVLGDFAEPHNGDLPINPASFFAVRERVRKTEEPARPGDPPEPEDFPLLVKPKEFVAISHNRGRVNLWRPIPPSDDYAALGCVALEPESSETPDPNSVLCVHKSMLAMSSKGFMLWADQKREGLDDISVWVVVPPLKDPFFHPATFAAVAADEDPKTTPFFFFRRHSAVEVLGVSLVAFKVSYGELVEKVRHPDTGFPLERKKKSLKTLKSSTAKKFFNGASAVDWLVKEYGLKNRKEGVMLGEQLRRIGLLARKDDLSLPFVDDQHVLFSFNDSFDNCTSSFALASSANGHSGGPRALGDGDEASPTVGAAASSLVRPFLLHQQLAPRPKLSPAVNNFGRQSIEGHAKRNSVIITKPQVGCSFGSAIVAPTHYNVASSAPFASTSSSSSFIMPATTTTTTSTASAGSSSFNGSSSSPPVNKRGAGDHHPNHHQHLHAKLSQRGGKFSSLTKKDRERMLDRERYDILNNGTADDHHSVGANGAGAEGKKEKKEGLLKGTFRGLVKPKSKTGAAAGDEDGSSTTATTASNELSPAKERRQYRLSGLSTSAATGLRHMLAPTTTTSAPTLAATAAPKKQARLFGVALEEVVRQADLTSEVWALPRFVEHALAFLEREENIVTLGLFRIAGKKPDADALRAAYDEGGVGIDMAATNVHPHTVAGVLKLFLRSLPETLLTARAYSRFLDAAQEPAEVMVERLKELLDQLPEINYVLLERLVRFFVLLTAHSEVNKMTASNVGALIGPNLVRREDTDPQELFRETNLLNSLVEFLIVHYSSLFQRVCAPKEPSVSASVLSDSAPAITVRTTERPDGDDGKEELDDSGNGDDEEAQSAQTRPRAGPRVERERTEGMEEWEGSDEDAEADDFAMQGNGEGGAKKSKKKSKAESKIKKKAENKTRPHRLSLSVKDDPSANKKAKKKKNKDKEKKDKAEDSLSAIRGKSKTASADTRRLVARERLSSSDIQAPTRRSSAAHLSSLDLSSLRDSSSGHATATDETVTVSWELSGDGSQSTSTDDKRPFDDLDIRSPPPDSEDGDEQDKETTPEPELAMAMAGTITRFGQEVDRDLVKLRKGSLEQMAEVATEKEVMRIIKLLREREVEEVKQFSRVKHMKEIKEREIRDMAERAALERELKRRERRRSTLMVHELVHKMLVACPPPPEMPLHTDTEQVLRERKAEKNREFFEKKITEGKVRSKEEIEAEVRLEAHGSRKVAITYPIAKEPKIASKLALFEEGHSQD